MNILAQALAATLALATGVAVPAAASSTPGPPSYHLAKSILMGSPDRWDYVHFDPTSHRVYAAHSTQITVIDGDSGKLVGRIRNIDGAHGVVTVPALGRGYADDGHSGQVTVFDLSNLKVLGHIAADKDADGMAYDAGSDRIVVVNGDSHDVSIIDPSAGKRLLNLPLQGGPEGVIADGHGTVYINIEDRRQIVRVDLTTNRITARWPITRCDKPHGLAIDVNTHRLFTSCENGQLLVVDADSGAILKILPIGIGSDTVVFDPKRKLVFSSNRDGTLSVIAEHSADDFEFLGNVHTATGARTMAEDVASGRIFVTTADVAETQVPARGNDHSGPRFKPGSVKLLMFDPATP